MGGPNTRAQWNSCGTGNHTQCSLWDVERPNPIPPERLRHREMIPGEPQPLHVFYVGPEQAGCHGKTEVAGQRDGLGGDELRYRELDDALGLTALVGDVLADARTGKNGRPAA